LAVSPARKPSKRKKDFYNLRSTTPSKVTPALVAATGAACRSHPSARAIRRCGELLKQFDARGGDRSKSNGDGTFAQSEAAREAGLSKRQQVTAGRVANVPLGEFEDAIESSDPPTITKLADLGKKTRPLVDLGGPDPHEYAMSTDGQGQLRFITFC
jgi:hypothetical protein